MSNYAASPNSNLQPLQLTVREVILIWRALGIAKLRTADVNEFNWYNTLQSSFWSIIQAHGGLDNYGDMSQAPTPIDIVPWVEDSTDRA